MKGRYIVAVLVLVLAAGGFLLWKAKPTAPAAAPAVVKEPAPVVETPAPSAAVKDESPAAQEVAEPVALKETEAARVRREYGVNLDKNRKIELLELLSRITEGEEDALAVLRLALDDPDPEIRKQAFLVLAANGLLWKGDIEGILAKGVADADVAVSEAAFNLLETIGAGRFPGVIEMGLTDGRPEIKEAILRIINVSDTSIPMPIYEAAARSPDSGVRYTVIGIVRGQQHPRGVPLIIDMMNDTTAEVRVEAEHSMYFLFDKPFESAIAAKMYWEANKDLYTEDLILKEEADKMEKHDPTAPGALPDPIIPKEDPGSPL